MSELAEKLLAKVLDWEPEDYARERKYFQTMAKLKYDQYEQFSPGLKYIESLALWLNQFEKKEERKIAYDFVKNHLIFISKLEMEHLIQIAYDDIIKPIIFQRIAELKKIPIYKLKELANEYKVVEKKCQFLGLSDGAHIDFFRRTHNLNNEQISLTYQIWEPKLKEKRDEIKDDLVSIERERDDFAIDFVILLDDFSGSSDTLLRKETKVIINEIPPNLKEEINSFEWGGKLWFKEKENELIFKGEMNDFDYEILKSKSSDNLYQEVIQNLYEKTHKNEDNMEGKLSRILKKIKDFQSRENSPISNNVEIIVVLYIATQMAIETLEERINKYKKPSWPKICIRAVQIIKNDYKVSELKDSLIEKLLIDYYNKDIMDEHLAKGNKNVIHGYSNCSLPLVLYHNTPNNSIYLLWAYKQNMKRPRALFKRVSRHKGE